MTRPCEPHDPVTEECDGCAPDAITRSIHRVQDELSALLPKGLEVRYDATPLMDRAVPGTGLTSAPDHE